MGKPAAPPCLVLGITYPKGPPPRMNTNLTKYIIPVMATTIDQQMLTGVVSLNVFMHVDALFVTFHDIHNSWQLEAIGGGGYSTENSISLQASICLVRSMQPTV